MHLQGQSGQKDKGRRTRDTGEEVAGQRYNKDRQTVDYGNR